MAGPFFDVYVVGASDPSPSGRAALAGALSGPLGMAAATITSALAERKLCAGKGMVQQDAQALMRELKALGAVTVVRPTAPSDLPTRRTAPPAARTTSPPLEPPVPPPTARSTPAPTKRPSLALSPSAPSDATVSVEEAFAPPPAEPPALSLRDETEGALGGAPAPPALGLGLHESLPPPTPPVGRDPFAGAPADDEPGLELDVPPAPAARSAEVRPEPVRPSASSSLPGASALNLNRMSASSSASGLSVDRAVAAEAYRVRCHKHGLLYDTRKASGCGKCLDKGRKLSAAMAERAALFELRFDSAIKRAFVGLALSLALGFIPAAYHAFRIGARDVHRLRDEQELLSRKPASEEIVRRFEDLNTTVENATSRATRTTGVVWLLVTGLAMAGWYRVTTEET